MEYDLTLYCTVTKQDGKIFYDGANTFGGLDDTALAAFVAVANDAQGHFDSNKGAPGKTYSVSLAAKAVDSNGAVHPSPLDGKRVSHDGVPYSAIVALEDKLMKFGMDLGKIGKSLAVGKHASDRQGGGGGGSGKGQGGAGGRSGH